MTTIGRTGGYLYRKVWKQWFCRMNLLLKTVFLDQISLVVLASYRLKSSL